MKEIYCVKYARYKYMVCVDVMCVWCRRETPHSITRQLDRTGRENINTSPVLVCEGCGKQSIIEEKPMIALFEKLMKEDKVMTATGAMRAEWRR